MKKILFLPILMIAFAVAATAQHGPEDIIGRWINTDSNLVVQVYKTGNEFRAKIVWFDDTDDKTRPMQTRCDKKNPDEALRNRKILGLEVMQGLIYNATDAEWQDGRIYDASSGKDWNAKAWLTNDGCLKVRGFWHFEFLGQNICFRKV